MNRKHHLLSGTTFIGKTTALLRIRDGLTLPSCGFHTQSVFDNERKSGLQLITSGGEVFHIADVTSGHGAERYRIDEVSLSAGVRSALAGSRHVPVVYVDEIGSLLCRFQGFVEDMDRLFETHTVIGTIARRGHPWIGRTRRRSDVHLIELDAGNRDEVVPDILRNLRQELEVHVGY